MNYSLVLSQMNILSVLGKFSWKTDINSFGSALFHMKSRLCLKYFVNLFSTEKIEKIDFWDATNYTNFKHQ